jgi:hypothetical protein
MDTTFFQLYIDSRRDEIADEIQRLRRLRADPVDIDTMKATKAIHEAQMKLCRRLFVDEAQARVMKTFMKNLKAVPDRNEILFPMRLRSTWLEFAEPLDVESIPFQLQGMLLVGSEPEIFEEAKRNSPQRWHAMLDANLKEFSANWGVDVIDAYGQVVFSFRYWPLATQDQWKVSDFHICPWQKCQRGDQPGTEQECKQCEQLRHFLLSALCVILWLNPLMPGEGVDYSTPIDTQATQEARAPKSKGTLLERSMLPAFLESYKEHEAKQIAQMRGNGADAFTIRATKVTYLFQRQMIQGCKIIYIDADGQDFIELDILPMPERAGDSHPHEWGLLLRRKVRGSGFPLPCLTFPPQSVHREPSGMVSICDSSATWFL